MRNLGKRHDNSRSAEGNRKSAVLSLTVPGTRCCREDGQYCDNLWREVF